MAGLSAALEAAEAGRSAILIEKEPFLGGRVSRMHQFFPKLCPPTCGLELYFRRIKNNPLVTYFTQAQVEQVTGKRGDFKVDVVVNPRYVVTEKCTACGDCVSACPVERPDDFNYGMGKTKAIYLPHLMAMPSKYVIDPSVCRGIQSAGCAECAIACRYGAVDLTMKPETVQLSVSSIVVATGWKPYDAAKLTTLGFGKYENVITNVMLERLAAMEGPTGGRIVRPGDGKEISSIGFVQCAGSRDENHLPYCSAVCCMASLKQVKYVRERYPEAQTYVFFMDIRSPGRYEDFYRKVSSDDRVKLVRGKAAKIEQDGASGDLIVEVDDTMSGRKTRTAVNMVVLATGMVPETGKSNLKGVELTFDQYGFAVADGATGIHPAGTTKRPMDVAGSVRDGIGAALKAIQDVVRS